MDQDLLKRYRAFRGRTGFVGHDAETSLALARAEQRAEAEGFQVVREEEREDYRDVYGDDPPEGVRFYWIAVYPPDVDIQSDPAAWLDALGFVDDVDPMYTREVIASLYIQALKQWDEQRDRDWKLSG